MPVGVIHRETDQFEASILESEFMFELPAQQFKSDAQYTILDCYIIELVSRSITIPAVWVLWRDDLDGGNDQSPIAIWLLEEYLQSVRRSFG